MDVLLRSPYIGMPGKILDLESVSMSAPICNCAVPCSLIKSQSFRPVLCPEFV